MTAGTVVITGGILAAVILLTIVTVLCYCRLQYYCCRKEESEGEVEETELNKSTLSLQGPLPDYASSNQLLMTTEPYEPNGSDVYSPPPIRKPTRSYTFCPSCSGILPFYLPHHDGLRNGGGRISYSTVQQEELNLPHLNTSSFHKLNMIRSVTMREVVTHHSISTDV
ncbi:protein FAM163B [Chanos chanos]|uniref:Protein FAM163B n=1 Tax=Chanos chanos TaxID=29144 RepID=A0A6J2WUE8_CHACN|nr:protein FAM163B-like [Chanos chanos]